MSARIIVGDALTELRNLPDESVHCCVTSPPYWGLRDYGTAQWDGGAVDCEHLASPRGGISPATSAKQLTSAGTLRYQHVGQCLDCGAVRVDDQIGLEPTIAEYIDKMVAVFREVRRVLRNDGTLWCNMGDSYIGGGRGGGGSFADERPGWTGMKMGDGESRSVAKFAGIKPKDLCGIPWRLAFALQADGWWLRQDIIWSKPNPMPESVTDRCTKAHEYVFLLGKSERYYYDADAIAEDSINAGRIVEYDGEQKNCATDDDPLFRTPIASTRTVSERRNKRSVWTVATQPYSEAHFATFPPDLIKPCILAGCPIGGTVLDPFGGAGTTALIADRLQRSSILIELNPKYVDMARSRLRNDAPLFVELTA